MPKLFRRCQLTALVSGLLVGVSLFWYRLTFKAITLRIFTSRDMDRALSWIHGNPVLYGPELSGGGVLPGPFAYLLLAVPLLNGIDWRLIAYWDIFLATLGAVLFFWFVRRLFGTIAAIFGFALYLSSHHVSAVVKQLVTSAFVLPFHVCCLLGLIYVFSEDTPKRRWIWYATCLACSLAIQLQMTAVYYVIAAVFLQVLARKLRISPIPRKEFWIGFAIFALPFMPFFIWLASTHLGLKTEPRAVELAGGFLSARIPQLARSMELIRLQGDSNLLRDLLDLQFDRNYLSAYLLGALGVLLPIAALTRPKKLLAALRRTAYGTHPRQRALRVALVICVLFAIIGLPWVIKRLGPNRYLIAFELSLFVVTSGLLARLLRVWKPLGWIALAAGAGAGFILQWEPFCWLNKSACIAAALLLLGFVLSKRGISRMAEVVLAVAFSLTIVAGTYIDKEHSLSKLRDLDQEKGRQPAAGDLAEALGYIYQQTGWSYAEARRRLFRLWIKHSTDFSIVYQSVASGPRDTKRHGSDGYFIFPRPKDSNIRDWKIWLLDNRLPPELKDGLRKGALAIGEAKIFPKVAIIPYFVADPYSLPQYFHNIGFSYDRDPEEDLLNGLTDAAGSVEVKKDDYLFYWNPCQSEICRSGMRVTIINRTKDTIEASVTVFGNPLSKSSPWYSPAWTQRFLSPSVSVTCGGSTDTQILATSIGYHTVTYQSDTFLAPFERRLRFKCKGKLTGIQAEFEKSLAHALEDRHNRAFTVPGVSKISRSL